MMLQQAPLPVGPGTTTTSNAVTFFLSDNNIEGETDNDDLLVSSPQTPMMIYGNDSIDDITNNNINNTSAEDYDDDHHDRDDSTSSLLQMRYPYYNNNNSNSLLQPNIGLRERTTSQSSAGDIYSSSRDRTFSQNSVEQLESQSQSTVIIHHHRRMVMGKTVNLSSSKSKVTTRSSSSSGTAPILSSTTPSKYSSVSHPTGQNYDGLRSFIESIQSIQVPIWILRYYRNMQKSQQPLVPASGKSNKVVVETVTQDNISDSSKSASPLLSISELQQQKLSKQTIDSKINDDDRTVVYWIQGLDRVLFQENTCCAHEVRLLGWKPPTYAWFALSGGVCDIIQLGMLYLLHVYVLPTNMDTSVSWMVAFCTSIFFRHTSHRFFVFGTYVGGYTRSLGRIYMGYSVTIVLSTILNYILNRILEVNLFLLAILTMAWTGVVNYFILKYFWNIGSSKSKSTMSSASSKNGGIQKSKHVNDMIDPQSLTATVVNTKS